MTKKRGSFSFGTDPAEVDASTYGPLSGLDWEKIDSEKTHIEAIFIDQIEPDFKQPRRTMPTAIRKLWRSSDLDDMLHLFGAWIKMAEDETGEKFPMERLLDAEGDGQDGSENEAEYFPIYYNLMQTTQLAAAIKRDKLKNPITVYRLGEKYKIETGERRWLACHELEFFYGNGRWEKIAAKVGEYDVWGQATENNQRSSLNAIGKARQFALLLMQLYPEATWKAYEDCTSDLEFYAQVADGDTWRIPRGKGGQLMNAMGEQNPVRLREYRTLLRLDQPTWERADDGNWKLGAVLSFVRPPGHTVQIRTVSGNGSPIPQGEEKPQGGDSGAAGEGFTQSSFILPGEQRAQASGLYPSSIPVQPINRGVPQSRPRYKIGDWVSAKGNLYRISYVRNWNAQNGQWYYELVDKAGRWAENELAPAEAPTQETPPLPTAPVIEEEDEEDWVEKPVKSTECIFDSKTQSRFKDLPKVNEDETYKWILTYGHADYDRWVRETEEICKAAIALMDRIGYEFRDEIKARIESGKTE